MTMNELVIEAGIKQNSCTGTQVFTCLIMLYWSGVTMWHLWCF